MINRFLGKSTTYKISKVYVFVLKIINPSKIMIIPAMKIFVPFPLYCVSGRLYLLRIKNQTSLY